MLDVILKRFESPDETRIFEKGRFEIVHIGGSTRDDGPDFGPKSIDERINGVGSRTIVADDHVFLITSLVCGRIVGNALRFDR